MRLDDLALVIGRDESGLVDRGNGGHRVLMSNFLYKFCNLNLICRDHGIVLLSSHSDCGYRRLHPCPEEL